MKLTNPSETTLTPQISQNLNPTSPQNFNPSNSPRSPQDTPPTKKAR